jgi:hypothetical protein
MMFQITREKREKTTVTFWFGNNKGKTTLKRKF